MAEERKRIQIAVREKIASLTGMSFELVGGNNDYDVVFDFDGEWAEYPVKTAVFVYGEETVEKVFDGDVCEGIAINDATICLIGVYAGDIATTTPACVSGIKRSITDLAKTAHKAPTEDVYNQIMELLNRYINAVKGAPKGGKAGQVLKKNSDQDYDYSWQDDISGGGSGGDVSEEDIIRVVEEYLRENPAQDGVSPTVSVVGITNGYRVTITDVNGNHTFELLNGTKGADGYTPIRGVDYWTEEDKAIIVQDVLNALPNGDEVAY